MNLFLIFSFLMKNLFWKVNSSILLKPTYNSLSTIFLLNPILVVSINCLSKCNFVNFFYFHKTPMASLSQCFSLPSDNNYFMNVPNFSFPMIKSGVTLKSMFTIVWRRMQLKQTATQNKTWDLKHFVSHLKYRILFYQKSSHKIVQGYHANKGKST